MKKTQKLKRKEAIKSINISYAVLGLTSLILVFIAKQDHSYVFLPPIDYLLVVIIFLSVGAVMLGRGYYSYLNIKNKPFRTIVSTMIGLIGLAVFYYFFYLLIIFVDLLGPRTTLF